MDISRRKFFQLVAVGSAAVCATTAQASTAHQSPEPDPNWYGMLNDSARCIGCKACQVSCKRENNLPAESSLDDAVYDSPRELSEQTYTLIKMYRDRQTGESTFVKKQCMHCVDPACQSACIVGALKSSRMGPCSMMPRSAWVVVIAWSPALSTCPSSNGTRPSR